MNELIAGIYVLGYLWAVRFVGGALAEDIDAYDAVDKFMCILAGMVLGWAWPIIAFSRITYVLWHKYGPENTDIFETIFPGPKEVESRRERQARKLSEREDELAKRERWVKERERQLR